jgi:hypothetical protein
MRFGSEIKEASFEEIKFAISEVRSQLLKANQSFESEIAIGPQTGCYMGEESSIHG